MATKLTPYLSFRGDAREAMTFYHSVLGGELHLSTFGEYGGAQDPADNDKIMHAQIDTPGGMTLMAADTPSGMKMDEGSRITVTLSGEDDAELSGYYNKLAEGGTVLAPLAQAPWGDKFGMLVDRYGIQWMVNIAGVQS